MINFENAFNCPLSTIRLSLSNANGSVRKTSKNDLVLDLVTLIQVVTAIPEMFEDLSRKLISILTEVYLRVDLVPDCYFKNFIKATERAKKNSATKMIIKSPRSKGPRGLSNFFSNKENKTCMIVLEKIALPEFSENTTDDPLPGPKVCVAKVNWVLSKCSTS